METVMMTSYMVLLFASGMLMMLLTVDRAERKKAQRMVERHNDELKEALKGIATMSESYSASFKAMDERLGTLELQQQALLAQASDKRPGFMGR